MSVLLSLIALTTSPLQFDYLPTPQHVTQLHLTSAAKNLSLQFRDGFLYADAIPVSKSVVNEMMTVSMKCVSPVSLHFATPYANSLVYSPTLCQAGNLALSIDDSQIHGCIFDVSQNAKILAERVCGHDSKNATKNAEKGPIYVAEPLELNEGGSIPIQWKNVYFMASSEMEQKLSHDRIFFTITESARHGEIRVDDVITSSFTYAQLLARRVIYRHDGSETREDRLGVLCELGTSEQPKSYTLKIKINGVNDAPRLQRVGEEKLLIASKGARILTPDILRVTDSDDRPERVKIQVVEAHGVHLELQQSSQKISEFTWKQIIDEVVSIVDDGVTDMGRVRLIARDGESRSQVVVLETQSTKVDVKLVANTGVRLLHHSSVVITARNLSFEASIKDMTVSYRIVDLPDTGIVECVDPNSDEFTMCTMFTQIQISEEQVRFRHTSPTPSSSSTLSDQFSFQVEAGEFASTMHVFRIDFIPMNIKVFTREPFVLNATELQIITRQNLFAWTFPKSFSAHNLIFHIDEPPKLGTLSRKIDKIAGKMRRIGVGSNFTQQDLDQDLISYKLHYQQYSIVNDFFVFRVVSPAVSSALMRFDIVYVPKASSVRLVNKTIVVKEGESASLKFY
ncbi:unnamed protein product [Caenorhabditis angaria]|uniref:Cadherin domain-containing protein n=1 Tax=Caenorhabditis angaria TaxID=860376 RepID=A0A9P1MV71_9PELO|nr:unnamed protein product [Caenorhabditis angaria]